MNPRFNTALGLSAITRQAKPPSSFQGVTSRVFPLRANMSRLRRFCDHYLNVAPEIVQFRPFLPYVYLMVLDYGRMASEVRNMGFVSQREVAFTVPLEWYDVERGMRFVDFAAVSPFIYVDDETSLSTGRQVYGWPKVKVWADQQVNPWLYDPETSQHLLRLSAMVVPELYRGERQQPKVLLEVRQEVTSSFSIPPDPSRPSNPLSALPEMMSGYLDFFSTLFEMSTGAPQLGFAGAPADPLSTFARMGDAGVRALGENPSLNNITLKQFRDSQHPEDACFQALVQSSIRVDRFNAMGLLGDSTALWGDPTGGFRLYLHRYAAQPIIESLGIEVAHEARHEGGSVAILRPLFPFWVDVDLEYGLGYAICWRSRLSEWQRGDRDLSARIGGGLRTDPGRPATSRAYGREEKKEPKPGPEPNRFNTALSGALQGVVGPFDFPNVTMRVLPLLADPAVLREFVREYLYSGLEDPIEDHHRFEAWGSYVYLVATNYEEMTSSTNNIGWWADRELTFFVPVKCYDAHGKLLSLGVVPAFPFVNTSTAAITGCEVRGQPTARAVLEKPPDVWMEESGPSEGSDQALLTCRATVVPALHLGQKQELRTLAEIRRTDALPYQDLRWRMVGARWGRDLLDEHRRLLEMKESAQANKLRRNDAESNLYELARAAVLELLARGEPVNQFSLKQFRDSEDPELACYQSVVRIPRWIDHIYDIREIEERLHVRIYEYPSMPIVRLLGLRTKWSTSTGEAKLDVLQPQRPFWMKVSLHEGLGWNLCWRAGSSEWQREVYGFREQGFGYFHEEGPTDVGFGSLEGLGTGRGDYGTPMLRQHLHRSAREWLASAPESMRFRRDEASKALDAIEPQLLVESMLSAEWEHWGAPRWFRKLHRGDRELEIKPDLCFRTDSVGDRREQNRFFEPLERQGRGQRTIDGEWYSEDERPDWPDLRRS